VRAEASSRVVPRTAYRAVGEVHDVATADQVVAILVKHKQLLQRPLIVLADRAFVGRPKERVSHASQPPPLRGALLQSWPSDAPQPVGTFVRRSAHRPRAEVPSAEIMAHAELCEVVVDRGERLPGVDREGRH
jgi:hypothetical protein